MLPARDNSTPAPPSATRASLADAVSRLPFPRPTRRRGRPIGQLLAAARQGRGVRGVGGGGGAAFPER